MFRTVRVYQLRGTKEINGRRLQAEGCEGATTCVAFDVTEQLIKPSRQHQDVPKTSVIMNFVGLSSVGNISLGGIIVDGKKFKDWEPHLRRVMRRVNVNPSTTCADDCPTNKNKIELITGITHKLDLGHFNRRTSQTLDQHNGTLYSEKNKEYGRIVQVNSPSSIKRIMQTMVTTGLTKGTKIMLGNGKLYTVKGIVHEFSRAMVLDFQQSGALEKTLSKFIIHDRHSVHEMKNRLQAFWRGCWVLKPGCDEKDSSVQAEELEYFQFPHQGRAAKCFVGEGSRRVGQHDVYFPMYPRNTSCFEPLRNKGGRMLIRPGFVDGTTYHAVRNGYQKLIHLTGTTSIHRPLLSKNGLAKADDRVQSACVENLNCNQQRTVPSGFGLEILTLSLLNSDVVYNIDRKRARDPTFPWPGHHRYDVVEEINAVARQAGDDAPFPQHDDHLPLERDNGERFYGDFLLEQQTSSSSSSSSSAAVAAGTLDTHIKNSFQITSLEELGCMRRYKLKQNKFHEGKFPCRGANDKLNCQGKPISELGKGRRKKSDGECTRQCPRHRVFQVQQAYREVSLSQSLRTVFAAFGSSAGSSIMPRKKRPAPAATTSAASSSILPMSKRRVIDKAPAEEQNSLLMSMSHEVVGGSVDFDGQEGACVRACVCKCARVSSSLTHLSVFVLQSSTPRKEKQK
jgi:hypothetical protein